MQLNKSFLIRSFKRSHKSFGWVFRNHCLLTPYRLRLLDRIMLSFIHVICVYASELDANVEEVKEEGSPVRKISTRNYRSACIFQITTIDDKSNGWARTSGLDAELSCRTIECKPFFLWQRGKVWQYGKYSQIRHDVKGVLCLSNCPYFHCSSTAKGHIIKDGAPSDTIRPLYCTAKCFLALTTKQLHFFRSAQQKKINSKNWWFGYTSTLLPFNSIRFCEQLFDRFSAKKNLN